MNNLDIHKHKMIIDKVTELISIVNPEQSIYLNKMLDDSKKTLDDFNWSNKTAVNPTPTELGMFRKVCLSVVSSYFHDCEYKSKPISIHRIVTNTDFSEELRSVKILFGRQKFDFKHSVLGRAINESIKLEIVKEYRDNNIELFI